MNKIRIKFDTDIEEINKQMFEFDSSDNIRGILNSFLKKTNSKNELSLEKIQFVYKGKLLNSPQFLEKNAKEIFRFQNHKIKVWDVNNIIGGELDYFKILFYLLF